MTETTNEPNSMVLKCLRGHENVVTEKDIKVSKTSNRFSVPCKHDIGNGETCKTPCPVSGARIAKFLGFEGDDGTKRAIEYFRAKESGDTQGATDLKVPPKKTTPSVSQEKLPLGNEDQGSDETPMQITPPATGQKAPIPPGNARTEETQQIIPPAGSLGRVTQDIRIPVGTTAGAVPAEEGYMRYIDQNGVIDYNGLMQYSISQVEMDGQTRTMLLDMFRYLNPGWEQDIRKLDDILTNDFRLPEAVKSKILLLFNRARYLLIQKKEAQDRVMRGVASLNSGFFPQNPPGYPSFSQYGPGQGMPGSGMFEEIPPGLMNLMKPPANQKGVDMKSLAIQALLHQNGGRVTPDIVAQIEEIMRSDMPGTGGAPAGAVTSPVQQMMELLFLMNRMQQGNQRPAGPDPAIEEIKSQMQGMQQMMMSLASRPAPQAVPQVPAESQQDKMFAFMMKILETNLSGSPKEDPLKEIAMNVINSAINGSLNKEDSVTQAIAALEAKLESQQGKGLLNIQGLPMHPEAIKGLVDLQKAYADIEGKKTEFQNNQENRQLIRDVVSTAAGQIGQAVATMLVQHPGTPQEQQFPTTETPLEDGSVVQTICPHCNSPVVHPANALAVVCPNCKQVFSRTPNGQGIIQQTLSQAPVQDTVAIPEPQSTDQPAPPASPPAGPEPSVPPIPEGHVLIHCPECNIPMHVPVTAQHIKCPICEAILKRDGDTVVTLRASPKMRPPEEQKVPADNSQVPPAPAPDQTPKEAEPPQDKKDAPGPITHAILKNPQKEEGPGSAAKTDIQQEDKSKSEGTEKT